MGESIKNEHPPHKGTRWKRRLVSMSIGVLVAFLIIEILAQLHTVFVLNPLFGEMRETPGYYAEARESKVLAYGLKRNFQYTHDDQRIVINQHGIRDERNEFPVDQWIVGILGDSGVFGIGLDQDNTLSALIEQRYKSESQLNGETVAETSVLNLGVPGYDMMQIQAQLQWTDQQYDPDQVVYILNFNDFCLRNTVREGGSNGLLRMHIPPHIKSPTYLRKIVYRIVKNGELVNPQWYRWLYDGTRGIGFDRIRAMSDLMTDQGKEFIVVILPVGCAYSNESYNFEDVHSEVRQFLDFEEIPFLDPYEEFKAADFDHTDHMHLDANKRMADLIWPLLHHAVADK